ncbi:MAG: hypothetical protein ACHRHE_13035 [Tepidisphaerales bacterium]
MGGIAEYSGSLVCAAPLGLAAAVALSPRDDGDVQVFSFNLLDANRPFTARISLSALASASADRLRADVSQPGRRWAGYALGCVFMLHDRGLVDLADPRMKGINLAVLSTVPLDAGVGSSSALTVATMTGLRDHFGLRDRLDPLEMAALCQQVEHRIVGASCGIADPVTSCLGRERELLRMLCQPHELAPGLALPPKIRVVGIHSGVRDPSADARYARTRCAAFMAHAMILRRITEMAHEAQPSRPCSSDHSRDGCATPADPTRGYLANLDQDHYKSLFRPLLPEILKGSDLLTRFQAQASHLWCRYADTTVAPVDPDTEYHVQQAADHHVLEARRVRQFVNFLEQAAGHEIGTRPRMLALDKAGHLMYASHISYTNDALLGAPECDLLVKLVRDREREGFYGARITSRGCGGTVAVLCNESERTDAALAAIMAEYEKQTGRKATLFAGTSPGACS